MRSGDLGGQWCKTELFGTIQPTHLWGILLFKNSPTRYRLYLYEICSTCIISTVTSKIVPVTMFTIRWQLNYKFFLWNCIKNLYLEKISHAVQIDAVALYPIFPRHNFTFKWKVASATWIRMHTQNSPCCCFSSL